MISVVTIVQQSDLRKLPVMFSSIPESLEIVIVKTIEDNYAHYSTPVKTIIEGREVIYSEYFYATNHFSFSMARNYAKSLATGDWIVSLDADEKLVGDYEIFDSLPESVGGVGVLTASFVPSKQQWDTQQMIRVFRNDPCIKWEFRCHEQILPSIVKAGYDVVYCDNIIQHFGYNSDAEILAKCKRNLPLMYADLALNPEHKYLTRKVYETLSYIMSQEAE